MYTVIVGNVGTVYDGASLREAQSHYREYRAQSKGGYGRAAGETVTLTRNGEPMRKHTSPVKVPPVGELTRLIRALKREIGDEYRVEGQEPDDTTPRMSVTVGCNTATGAWSYQTGDNSYTGGAYGFRDWAVVEIDRGCNSRDVARDIREQLREMSA